MDGGVLRSHTEEAWFLQFVRLRAMPPLCGAEDSGGRCNLDYLSWQKRSYAKRPGLRSVQPEKMCQPARAQKKDR